MKDDLIGKPPLNAATGLNVVLEDIETNDKDFVALALFEDEIKVVSLTKDGKHSFLDDNQNYYNIIYRSFSETIILQEAIDEFEYLVKSSKPKEDDFQNFFERNPEFILNDDYKQAHSHIVLAKEDNQSLIPDFVLEPVNQDEFCDLLEIKLPSAKTYIMKKSREHFSASITEAAAQLRTYRDYFNEEKNRNNFKKTYPNLSVYKPKMFIIIGRQGNENPMIKREIQSENPQLILKNFDEILNRMKYKKEKLKNKFVE